MSLREDLERLKPQMATATQKIVDEWQQDEEGYDEVFGAGGICDEVAGALLDVIYGNLDVEASFGAPEGEDHEWIVVTDGQKAFIVDIPPWVYERGSGYSWKKIEGAIIRSGDIVIEPLDVELARGIISEGYSMKRTLLALAGSLEKLGERNSAQLVATLAHAEGIGPQHADTEDLIDPFKQQELEWPFPAPQVLKDPTLFIQYALSKHPEHKKNKRRGEIEATKKEITHLLKEEGPKLASLVQQKWSKAYNEYDQEEMWRLKQWWIALGKVWTLLQIMLRRMNEYERQHRYSEEKHSNFWQQKKD